MDLEALIISLCQRLGCTYEKDGDDFVFNVTLDDRKQSMTASFFEESDENYLRLSTTIDSRENLKEKKLVSVLELNYSLLHGNLALFGGDLVLTDVISADDVKPETLEPLVRYLALMGDNYEKFNAGADMR